MSGDHYTGAGDGQCAALCASTGDRCIHGTYGTDDCCGTHKRADDPVLAPDVSDRDWYRCPECGWQPADHDDAEPVCSHCGVWFPLDADRWDTDTIADGSGDDNHTTMTDVRDLELSKRDSITDQWRSGAPLKQIARDHGVDVETVRDVLDDAVTGVRERTTKRHEWEDYYDHRNLTVERRYVDGPYSTWWEWRVQYGKDTVMSPNSEEDAFAELLRAVEQRGDGDAGSDTDAEYLGDGPGAFVDANPSAAELFQPEADDRTGPDGGPDA